MECNDYGVDKTVERLLCDCPIYAIERLHLRIVLKQLGRRDFTVEKVLEVSH